MDWVQTILFHRIGRTMSECSAQEMSYPYLAACTTWLQIAMAAKLVHSARVSIFFSHEYDDVVYS